MASYILSINSRLSVPPNRPLVFRDISLYGKVFCHMETIVSPCPFEEWDYYAAWFRRYGLFDFVDGLVKPGEVSADVEIEDRRLDESTLSSAIALISRFRT